MRKRFSSRTRGIAWQAYVTMATLIAAALIAIVAWMPVALGQELVEPREELSDAERRGLLAGRDRLWKDAHALEKEGKLQDAITAANKALAIERRVFGEVHAQVATTLSRIAALHEKREDFDAAEKVRQEVLTIHRACLEVGHWEVIDARLALAHTRVLKKLTPQQRRRVREAYEVTSQWEKFRERGDYLTALPKALPRAVEALKEHTELLGDKHPYTIESLDYLGILYRDSGDHAKAEPLLRRALALRKTVFGDRHPRYAFSLNVMGLLHLYKQEWPAAEACFKEARTVSDKTIGERHAEYANALDNLASVYYSTGQYAKAEPLFVQALEIRRRALGEKHAWVASTMWRMGQLYAATNQYVNAEKMYVQSAEIGKQLYGPSAAYAHTLDTLGKFYFRRDDFTKAERVFQEAGEVYRTAYGEKHKKYADNLHNLAYVYRVTGAFGRAEPLAQKAVDIYRLLGNQPIDLAMSLDLVAKLRREMGDYREAETLYRQALTIIKEKLGEKDPLYAFVLNNLGVMYIDVGDYAQGERLCRAQAEIAKGLPGEKESYATSLANLGAIYRYVGDYAKAEALMRQALEVRKEASGENSMDYAISLEDMALLCDDRKDYARAERLFEQSLEIQRRALEDKYRSDPSYAITLDSYAGMMRDKGDYLRAEPLLQEAMDIRRRGLGKDHPAYANSVENLATLRALTGDHDGALRLYQESLAIRRNALEDQHPNVAWNLRLLAAQHCRMGQVATAEPLYRQSLAISRQRIDTMFAVQSERQQLAMCQSMAPALHGYVSVALAPESKVPPDEAYQHALTWKGSVLTQQSRMRALRDAPKLKSEFDQYLSVCMRLAARSLSTPTAVQRAAWLKDVEELTDAKEKLEQNLSARSEEFRRQQAAARLTPRQLQGLLPQKTALIDFLQYTHSSPLPEGKGKLQEEQRLVAFIIRSEGEIALVPLGSLAPIAETIDEWRRTIKAKRFEDRAMARKLRDILWARLEKHLEGADTILISPDGPLSRFAWAALPGKEPATYLIEERAIALVPVAQLLPQLLAANLPDKVADNGGSLLTIGDVDYGGSAGAPGDVAAVSRSAAGDRRDGKFWNFVRLQQTRAEAASIAQTFQRAFPRGKVQQLHDEEATESAFRSRAGQHRWLHLATHGYFAPPGVKSALAPPKDKEGRPALFAPQTSLFARHGVVGAHPGLLSGLALAGANHLPKEGEDDGILTALEVASLDLRVVEMAVFSACDTGLGEVAGGEGPLGLQRALQVSGARTAVCSLWSVDDAATRELMVRFYNELWHSDPANRPSKLKALRQAQLWMLREGGKKREGSKERGFDPDAKDQPETDRLPPYYWAAFVLSGDWR
jgi:CHAT domain-containing protein